MRLLLYASDDRLLGLGILLYELFLVPTDEFRRDFLDKRNLDVPSTGPTDLLLAPLRDVLKAALWRYDDREHLLRDELISPEDLNFYQITHNADEAVKIITRFYRNFQSTRFVKDLFIIRLKNAPSESALAAINEDFADIINGEPIKPIKPTPEEVEGRDSLDLARIAFGFNRRDYGRLRQLIDVLNGL